MPREEGIMKLSLSRLLVLVLLGALVAPFGDHGHVATATTAYLEPAHALPFIWDSPPWFPLMVGLATAATAELRLRLAAPRTGLRVRDGIAGIAAVMGLYALTALLHGAPLATATLLVAALAILTWRGFGDGPALVCGILVGIAGTAVESGLVAGGIFRYAGDINRLFGVAPWLPALYFAFGVVAAQLGEIAAARPRVLG
jgi:hypothetical protein